MWRQFWGLTHAKFYNMNIHYVQFFDSFMAFSFYELTWHLNSNWGSTKIVKFHWILLIKPPSQQTHWCRNLPFICFICWELHIHPHGEFHNLFIPPKLWILSRWGGEMFSFPGNISAIPPNAGNTLIRNTLHATSVVKW